jgi:hypothetical protein
MGYSLIGITLLWTLGCLSTSLLDHSYNSCLESSDCMKTFELTTPHNPRERQLYDLVLQHLLDKEASLDFALPENNNTLTGMLYWGVCETAETLGVNCGRKINRDEIDHMLNELDSKKCPFSKD